MFAQYKDELGHVLRQSAEKLSVAGGYADDPARALDLLRECDGLLGQAGDLAKQLDVEVRSAAPNDKKALQDEAAPLRETLKTLQQSARDARAAAERRAVLGGGVSDASAGSRGRLADANARAQQQTVPNSNLQIDFNVSVRDSFDDISSAVLRELDESNRFVQKSAESTSI